MDQPPVTESNARSGARPSADAPAPSRRFGGLDPRHLWLAAAALIIGAATAIALTQEPRPDPWRPVQTLSPDWWRYPVERNAFRRLPVISGNLRAVHAHPDGMRLWAVGEAGLIVHSADGGRSWRRQEWVAAPAAASAVPAAPPEAALPQAVPSQAAPIVPSGFDVRQVQERLAKLGFYKGPADGVAGPALQAAIRAFQQKLGLPADGILDPRTAQELGLYGSAYSPAQQAPVAPKAPRELNIVPDAPKKASELPSLFPEARAALPPEQNAPPARQSAPLVQQQTRPQKPVADPVPRGVPDLNAIFFLPDALTGWVAGGDGTILRTEDGGATWTPQNSGTSFGLNAVVFRDARNGWAVSDGGTIIRSSDGGANWSHQANGGDSSLHALAFSDRVGLAVGRTGTIFRSADGGATWAPQVSGTKAWLNGVAFADARNAWAVGERGTILRSTDGGTTWTAQASNTQARLNAIAFGDARNGWAIGERGLILRTVDGGENWAPVESGTDTWLVSFTFIDPRNGWAVGQGGTVLRSTDGGATWAPQTGGPQHVLAAVVFSGPRNGWAVSARGTILRTADGGVTWTPQPSATDATLQAVAFPDSGNGWVVGAGGTIRRTADGGASWTAQTSGTDALLRSVAISDASTGWIVGDRGTILRTTDSGTTWTVQPSGTRETLASVAFTDARSGWAVGSAGTILRSSDGGATWSLFQPSVTRETLTSVAFSDPRNGWAAGKEGTIFRTADGGATWRPQASGTKRSLDAIAFSDARTGWVAGEGGLILHTLDGGATWTPQSSGTRADLNAVTFTDARNGWAIGAGAILRTADGGRTWLGGELPGASPLVSYSRFPAPWWYLALLTGLGSLGMALRPPRPQVRAVASVADLALSDRPLEAGDRDAMNFRAIALGLSNFLRNAATEPPLTLSITGDWGSGKSSLMNLLREDLRSRGFRPVWFNPWHQPKEANLLAALIATIRAQALPRLASAEGLRFRWQLAWVRTRERPLWVAAMVFLAAWLVTYFGMKPAHLTAAIEWLPHFAKVLKADDPKSAEDLLAQFKSFAALVAVLGPLLTAWRGLKAFGVNPGALAVSVAGSLKQADAQSRFLNDYARQFQEVAGALRPRTLAIFMDDLDRCPPERVREALEAVNYLVSSGPCFVVLGMARERVEACVGLAFKDVAQEMVHLARMEDGAAPVPPRPPDDEARRHRRHYARDYLKKLVNIEIPVPAPNEGQAKGLVGAVPDYTPPTPAEPAWRGLARSAARAWPLVMVVAVAVFGWWSAVKTPDVAPPAPPPVIEVKPAGDAVTAAAPAGAARKEGDPGKPERAFREAYVVPGQKAPLPVPAWLVPLAVLLAAGSITLLRRPQVVEQDSRDFRRSLANWLPLVAARQNTPREVKRFVNRVRLLAMRQRAEGKNPARLAEPTLVALAALHHVDESLLDPLPMPGGGASVATQLAQAGHAWGHRIAAPLDTSLAAHASEVSWPPGPDEVELFRALVGSVRLD